MPNYNADLQANNAELDAIKQMIDNLPKLEKPEVNGTGTVTSNGQKTFTPPAGSVFTDFTVTTNVYIPPDGNNLLYGKKV